MLEMELPGRSQRGRPKRRFMDAVTEDMQVVGIKSRRYREQVEMETDDSLWQPLKRDKPNRKEEVVFDTNIQFKHVPK